MQYGRNVFTTSITAMIVLMMEAVSISETSVNSYQTAGAVSVKTTIFIVVTLNT
jgi:hypothetical protein